MLILCLSISLDRDIQDVLIGYVLCRVLKVYPNGVGHATGNSLSLFLLSASNEKGYVKAKLRVIDQIRSTHVEKQGLISLFSASSTISIDYLGSSEKRKRKKEEYLKIAKKKKVSFQI